MTEVGCDYVRRYMGAFLDHGERVRFDLQAVSEHVADCTDCHAGLTRFFRTVELPDSEYLKETIDELALALYNLAKAIIRDLPASGPDDETEGVHITEEGGGSVDENLEAGREMIDDAEDFTGSSRVGGMDLEELRDVLQSPDVSRIMRIDLALDIFARVTSMPSRYESEAWNWMGVLFCQKGDLDRAEGAFLKVLGTRSPARNVRSLARCNLSYVHQQRGELDLAIREARRAVVLAEEDGKDPYFGRFAGLYFHLLRGQSEDVAAAEELLEALIGSPGGVERLRQNLVQGSNAPVLEAFRRSPLAARHPQVLA